MAQTSDAQFRALEACLLNISGDVPLHKRFRALFTLKSINGAEAIDIISKGFGDPSALLKHELAYCLGQMKNPHALPILTSVLRDESEDPMVRHEAAEALGAISTTISIPVLREFLSDPERTVRETCEIAIAKIEWDNSEEGQGYSDDVKAGRYPTYSSVDPAPPMPDLLARQLKPDTVSNSTVSALRITLLDTSEPLFKRYRAMFALRNIGTDTAVDALAAGFADDSALFKHEIAFVFGQLLSPHSVPSLLKVLENTDEVDMVRHEAAEALGGIATPEALPHLKSWMNREDSPRLVRESCQVAIDMWEFENSTQLQYADEFESMPKTEPIKV